MVTIPEMRKAVAAFAVGVAGVVGQIIAANVVTGTALHWAQVILASATAVAGTLGVYQIQNVKNPAPTDS